MAEYIEYHPLKFWLDPASIAEIVAHIQAYLVANPINSTTEIETIIHDYLIAHPELIGGVDSVNGLTGEVVLTADNISGGENVTIKDVLDSLQDQIDDIINDIYKPTANMLTPKTLDETKQNVRVISQPDGGFLVNGQATSSTVFVISEVIDLSPGVYKYGCIPEVNASNILQIRRVSSTGGDGGSLAPSTSAVSELTITEPVSVYFRIYVINESTYDNIIVYPMITPAEEWPTAFIPNKSVADYVSRNKINDLSSEIGKGNTEKASNMLHYPDTTAFTRNGITFTFSEDGTINTSGSPESNSTVVTKFICDPVTLEAGEYYVGSRNGIIGGIYWQLYKIVNGSATDNLAYGSGLNKIVLLETTTVNVRFATHNGDLTGYPIRLELFKSTENDQVYIPYGKSILIDSISRGRLDILENRGLPVFAGRRMAIIGDSISTYSNAFYCNNKDYVMYYPSKLITDVDSPNKTWWKIVADCSDCDIVANLSEAGAYASNQRPDGRIDFYARAQVLRDMNINPEIIIVALGTNDSVNSVAVGTLDFDTAYASLSEDTFGNAYIKGIKALQDYFPNAEIISVVFKMDNAYKNAIEEIATTLDCGLIIQQDYKTGASVHPNAEGMRTIAKTVIIKQLMAV